LSRTIPRQTDSVSKLIERLAAVAREPVTRDGKLVLDPPPERVLIDQSVILHFHCAEGCTACCQPFSLDFIEQEFAELHGVPNTPALYVDDSAYYTDKSKMLFLPRKVEINGERHRVFSYDQEGDERCPNLLPMADGNLGCSMWPHPPLECATAPNLHMDNDGKGTTTLRKRPFRTGATWKPPAQCEFHPPNDPVNLAREVYLLKRYEMWADHFGIPTVLDSMVEAVVDLPNLLMQTSGRPVQIEIG
jgi:hypothetical protein